MCNGRRPGASKVYPYDNRYAGTIVDYRFIKGIRDRYLREFKEAALGLRGTNPVSLKIDEWWALGRHFGLITPLLDWTTSPYIAAFFALSGLFAEMSTRGSMNFTGRKVAVYRLSDGNGKLQGDGLKVIFPQVDELVRMRGQRGLFTWLESEKYLELQGFLEDTGRGRLLKQLAISDEALFDGLRHMRAHGMDYRLLFPDLAGAAMYANAKSAQAIWLAI
jgi:FRG domain